MITRSLVAAVFLAGTCVIEAAARGQAPPAGLDRYGDPLPHGALLRLGTTRLQTKGGFAWLPDGKSIVTLKYGKVTFWDIADGHALESFYVPVGLEKFSSYATQLALSPDGKRLVCTDTKGAIAVCTGWAEGRVSTIVTPATETENGRLNLVLIMLKDGQTFVTLRRTGELEFRDISTMAVRRSVLLSDNQRVALNSATLSPDGKTLALPDARTRSIILVKTSVEEEPVVIEKAHKGFVDDLAFLPDGRLISSASIRRDPPMEGPLAFKGEVRLWNITKREAIADWPIEDSTSGCGLGVSPDGSKLVTVLKDRILVWDVKTQGIIRRIEGVDIRNPMSAHVEIDPTGTYLAVDDHDNYVRVWELATGKPLFGEGQHEQGLIFSAAWMPDGKTVATSSRRDIFLWNVTSGEVVRRFRGPGWGAAGMLFSPDGNELIVCGQDPNRLSAAGAVWWHDPLTGKVLRKVETTGQVRLPVLSPDRALLAYNTMDLEGAGMAVEVVEAATGKLQTSIANQGFHGVGWSAEGRSIYATSGENTLIQTHLATKAVVSQLNLPHQRRDRHTGELVAGGFWHCVFFRNAARVVTTGTLPEMHAWDLTTGRKLWTIPLGGFARALTLSPDEKVIACVVGGDQESRLMQIFDVASQRKLVEFDLGSEHSQCLSFSPDGRRLLVGLADGTSLIMDATLRQ